MLLVPADVGVAGVLASHQRAARGRAHGAAGVELREARAFPRHAVQPGRAELRLAVRAHVSVAEVVGQDEDDVGPARRSRGAPPAPRHVRRRRAEPGTGRGSSASSISQRAPPGSSSGAGHTEPSICSPSARNPCAGYPVESRRCDAGASRVPRRARCDKGNTVTARHNSIVRAGSLLKLEP